MAQRLRYWMSGCVAVISLAVGGLGDAWADDVDPRPGLWQISRFDMGQTLQRLRACAPQHGWSVIACWEPRAGSGGSGSPSPADAHARSILVFATREGGTPVLMMDGSAACPDLPLSLRLRTRSDGRVEVLLPNRRYDDALPSEVVRELTELPGLVAEALA